MKKVGLMLALVLLSFACSKQKKALKKIDGVWVMTKAVYPDTGSEDLTGIRRAYTFDKNKKKDEPGTGRFDYQIPAYGQDLQWTITYLFNDDATKLTVVRTPSNFTGEVQTIVYNVEELTKTKMTLYDFEVETRSEWEIE